MIPTTPNTVFAAQLIAHLALIPMIIYAGAFHWFIALFVYFLTGCFGMTMTYHRLLSHKAWNPPKWLEYLFVLFATMGLTGSAISWVAVHRQHHTFVDGDKDPHNPKTKGFLWSHFLSMYAKVEIRYASSLLRDKFYHFQHKHYLDLNLLYAAVLLLIDPFAIIYAWLVPACILWNGGSSIVSFSHRSGYPHNDTPLALLVWGEGYHATHHAKANSQRWGKFDLGGILIQTFEKFFNGKK